MIQTVKQGEHLAGIAKEHGFEDYRTIWDHPDNAELKEERGNPNVLFPGDQVFVPDIELREEIRATGKRHVFQTELKPLNLRLKLEKGYDQPRTNTECDLLVDSEHFALTSDGKGQIEHVIRKNAIHVTLVLQETLEVKDKQVPFETKLDVKIGHLDPVEKPTGQRARLANLGYYRVPLEELDQDEFLSSVEEFQCEHGLTVDGDCGPNTQAKLKQVHGC